LKVDNGIVVDDQLRSGPAGVYAAADPYVNSRAV
jgi:hypothetical protein